MGTMSPMEDRLIEVREAAKTLGVHENTVRRWADRGLIGHLRNPSGVRRLRAEDVDALRRQMELPAGADARVLEDLMRAQGVQRTTFDDLEADLFDSDAEAEAFLTAVYAARDAS